MKHAPGLYLTQANGHSTRVAGNGAALVMAALAVPAMVAAGIGICLAVPMTAGGLAWKAAGWLRGKRCRD